MRVSIPGTHLFGSMSAVLPWFVPGVLLSMALGLVAGGPLGRLLGAGRVVGTALIVSLGIAVSATLTPLGRPSYFDVGLPGYCDLSRIGPAPIGDLLSLNDASLNVLLFIPLGLTLAFLPLSRRTAVVLGGAIALPFAIELTQLLVTALGRGCESADVADNLTGIAIGLGIGVVIRGVVSLARRGAGPERSAVRSGSSDHG